MCEPREWGSVWCWSCSTLVIYAWLEVWLYQRLIDPTWSPARYSETAVAKAARAGVEGEGEAQVGAGAGTSAVGGHEDAEGRVETKNI